MTRYPKLNSEPHGPYVAILAGALLCVLGIVFMWDLGLFRDSQKAEPSALYAAITLVYVNGELAQAMTAGYTTTREACEKAAHEAATQLPEVPQNASVVFACAEVKPEVTVDGKASTQVPNT